MCLIVYCRHLYRENGTFMRDDTIRVEVARTGDFELCYHETVGASWKIVYSGHVVLYMGVVSNIWG